MRLSNELNHSRSSDPVLRRKYVDMAEMAKNQGAEVLIFSSMHETGQRERFIITVFSMYSSGLPHRT